MSMDTIPITVIVLYLVGTTAAGIFMARRAKSSAGWAVAGGGMSTSMIAFGIAGTRIGGGGTYGVAGNVISGGVWNLWWYGINTFLALAITGLFFGVFYRRLKLHTVGELFTIRFGNRRCQWLTSFCVQTEYAIVNLIEAYVIGIILSAQRRGPAQRSADDLERDGERPLQGRAARTRARLARRLGRQDLHPGRRLGR